MSGTPSISDAYAVLASRKLVSARLDSNLSLVILCRGPRMFRSRAWQFWAEMGFRDVSVVFFRPLVEPVGSDEDSLGFRFLVPLASWSVGTGVNAAIREALGQKILVVWDDQILPEQGLSSRVAGLWLQSDRVVLAPELRRADGLGLPSVRVPVLVEEHLKVLSLGTDEDSVATLFPTDFSGLYDRRRFLQTGGFDPELGIPFWQRVDWGFRAWLWGEKMTVERGFLVDYLGNAAAEDQTPDQSYARVYLRNLAVRFLGDHGSLTWRSWWKWAPHSGIPWARAWRQFRQERRWVYENRYRFQADSRWLLETWGSR